MEKKRLTVHGNEVTDGRFAWVTPEKDIELLRKGIQGRVQVAGLRQRALRLRAGGAFGGAAS